jgi:hypothetical protein
LFGKNEGFFWSLAGAIFDHAQLFLKILFFSSSIDWIFF